MLSRHFFPNTTSSSPESNYLPAKKFRVKMSLCLIAVALAVLPPGLRAQEMSTITRALRFVRGRAVVSGSARQYTRYVYTFRAAEGQGFDMRITGGVSVTLLEPNSTYPLAEDETEGINTGLPNTGTYKVIVTNKSEGTLSLPFKLRMTLSAPEKY